METNWRPQWLIQTVIIISFYLTQSRVVTQFHITFKGVHSFFSSNTCICICLLKGFLDENKLQSVALLNVGLVFTIKDLSGG